MSRQVKQVPLDFEWPLNKVWEGYLMSDNLRPATCEACQGTGLSPTAKKLQNRWYGYEDFKPEDRGSIPFTPNDQIIHEFAKRNIERSPKYFYRNEQRAILSEANRLCGLFNSQWSHHLNQDDVDALIEADRLHDLTKTGHHPTAQEVNKWSIDGFGHDSINQFVVMRAECKRLSVSVKCSACRGEGRIFCDEDHRQAYDSWTSTEPPAGEGWQMWETTSAGSPISPVFSSPEQLATWLAETGASAFGGQGASYADWLAMINVGWAPSAVQMDGEMKSGVEAIAKKG